MKPILTFIFAYCCNYCFCQSTNTEIISLQDSLVIKIDYAEDYKGYGTGSGFVTAKKGFKFVGVYVHISNPTKGQIDVDLKNAYLVDTGSLAKYGVYSVMGTGPFTSIKKNEQGLKPGKELYRKLVFVVPKEIVARFLSFRSTLIPISSIQN